MSCSIGQVVHNMIFIWKVRISRVYRHFAQWITQRHIAHWMNQTIPIWLIPTTNFNCSIQVYRFLCPSLQLHEWTQRVLILPSSSFKLNFKEFLISCRKKIAFSQSSGWILWIHVTYQIRKRRQRCCCTTGYAKVVWIPFFSVSIIELVPIRFHWIQTILNQSLTMLSSVGKGRKSWISIKLTRISLFVAYWFFSAFFCFFVNFSMCPKHSLHLHRTFLTWTNLIRYSWMPLR